MSLTLIELFGVGGFVLAVLDLCFIWARYRKDKPLIKIEKKAHNFRRIYDNLQPVEYANKALKGEFNNGALNYVVGELDIEIINKGHRDAKLKRIKGAYHQKGIKDFYPETLNYYPTTIMAGDKDCVPLYFKIPIAKFKQVDRRLPYSIIVEFDFAHKIIKKIFPI